MRRLWTLALRDQRIFATGGDGEVADVFSQFDGEVRESERFRSFLMRWSRSSTCQYQMLLVNASSNKPGSFVMVIHGNTDALVRSKVRRRMDCRFPTRELRSLCCSSFSRAAGRLMTVARSRP
jgi:hypothetical protein